MNTKGFWRWAFHLFLGLIALSAVIGCVEKVIEEPEDLIDEVTMTDILYDLSVLNALQSTSPGTLSQWDLEIMDIIYARYGIDSTRFADSDAYYASLPIRYKNMYDSVQKRLESTSVTVEEIRKLRNEKAKEAQSNKARLDSIKKANGVPPPVTIKPAS